MASTLQHRRGAASEHPGHGRVTRRPQTTAKRPSDFISSTAKYTMNVWDSAGIPMSQGLINPVFKSVPGYISRVWITIYATGGAAGGSNAVAAADAPYNAVQTLTCKDASGYTIASLDGYAARLATILGGQAGPGIYADPGKRPSFSAIATSGNFTLRYELNFELGDGVGCFAGAGQDRLPSIVLNMNPSSTIYSTAPNTLPTYEVRVDVEFYGAPLSNPALMPRALGSSVQWGSAIGIGGPTSAGQQNVIVPAPNLTGYLGTLIAVARNTTGAREDGVWSGSNDIELWVDQQQRRVETYDEVQDRMARDFMLGLGSPFLARPTGVIAYTFRDSILPNGPIGYDSLKMWEPTDTGSLFELRSGAWGTITSGPDAIQFVTQRFYPVDDFGEFEHGLELP